MTVMDDAAAASNPRKRKTHRACDYCRDHRIRCVYEGSETCKHCLDYDIQCVKVAPPPKDTRPRKRFMIEAVEAGEHQGMEPVYLGGSSLSQLAWLFCPASVKRKLHALDLEHDLHRGAICDSDEQGLLIGRDPQQSRGYRSTSTSLSSIETRLAELVGASTVLRDLYDTASTRIITVFPVISKHESLLNDEPDQKFWERFIELHHNSTPPTPLPGVVRIIHCALASMSREVSAGIRQNVLSSLQNSLASIEFERLCRTSTISSIQVLILLTMCDELNGNGSASPFLKLGAAIRMAQELALHRNVSLDLVPLAQRNRRARVWGACVCADRWMSLRHGQALAIDLDMCDVSLPQEYPDHVRDSSSGKWSPSFRFLAEFTKMSILLGRAYRLTCSPIGLSKADDVPLLVLQTEIDMWVTQLPRSWPYSPTLLTPSAEDLMNIFYVALEFTFLRPFLWPTAPLPPHITFRPAPQRWSALVLRAQQATLWAESSEGTFFLDVWSNVLYPLVCCLFIHLKLYEQTQREDAKIYLERTDNVIQSWASQHPGSARRSKIAAITGLLRQSMGPSSPMNTMDNLLTPGGSLADNWLETITAAGGDYDFGLV